MLTVIYDACVLYPAPLRDFLMHLALQNLFRARWTDQIHEEWITAVLSQRPDLTRRQLEKTRALMDAHVLDCLVHDYEHRMEQLSLPDPDDCHVLAAAIQAEASIIITFNLKDFPPSRLAKWGVVAMHPDPFIATLIKADPSKVYAALRKQQQSLRNPPRSMEELLETLRKQGLNRSIHMLQKIWRLIEG